MIQKITEDENGNTVLEFDDEGIEYLVEGLLTLRDEPIGGLLSTPAIWTRDVPWWRFWNREGEPVVGEFFLKKVE